MFDTRISDKIGSGTTQVRRAIGHPSAPVTTEALVTGVRARLTAIEALTTGQVTGEALTRARDAHLFAYADYIARYPVLAGYKVSRIQCRDSIDHCSRTYLARSAGLAWSGAGLATPSAATAETGLPARPVT